MGVEVLECLFICNFLDNFLILTEKCVIGILKDHSGLFLKFKHTEILNVLPHHIRGSCHWTLVSHSAVGHRCNISYSSIPGAHIFLKVVLEACYFFVGLWVGYFFLYTFWNQLAKNEFRFLLSCLGLSFCQSCSSVFWNLTLHLLNLLLCVMLLLFHVLILVSNLGLLVRERLLPCRLYKTEKFVISLFLFSKSELISFR